MKRGEAQFLMILIHLAIRYLRIKIMKNYKVQKW